MLLSIFNSETKDRPGPRAALLGFAASFAITLLLLGVATEWLLQRHITPQDTRAAHLRLLDVADSADAAFGDSHVARGFDAQAGFVNLAYPSENIEDMIAKIGAYYSDRTPGRIILQADPHLFAPYRLFSAPQTYAAPVGFAIFSERHRLRLLAYWQAYLRGAGHLASKVKLTAAGSLLSEGDLSKLPPRKRLLEAQIRRNWHRIEKSERMVTAQKQYATLLDDLLELGAQLCLVSFPVSADYSQAVESAGHDELIAFFEHQAQRTGSRYIDARDAIQDRQLFRDVDHLNRPGAQHFSQGLINMCFAETG